MPIGLRLTTAPAAEPVTLDSAMRVRLRLDGTDEDTDVTELLAECREAIEGECRRAFITQTWTLTLDEFPCGAGEIRLPMPPLQTVTWVKYYDGEGTQQTLDPADYHVAAAGEPGRIWPVYGAVWPTTQYGRPEAVEVKYVAGYGATGASVPRAATAAIKLLAAERYMHRGDGTDRAIPAAVRRLLDQLEYGEA